MEKTIGRGFRRWTAKMFGEAQSDALVVVHRAILEEIEGHVQTAARGKRVFAFARVAVTLVSADAARRAVFEAAFEGLEDEVRRLLEGALPRGFAIEVKTAEEGTEPFEIAYSAKPLEEPV